MPQAPRPSSLLKARRGGLATLALLGTSYGGGSFVARAFPLPSPPAAAATVLQHQHQHQHQQSQRAWGGRRHQLPPLAMLSSSTAGEAGAGAAAGAGGNWSPAVYVPDQQRPFRLSDFALPKHLLETGELESILLPSGMIRDRIDKMAQDLLADIAGPSTNGNKRSIHLICTLKGAGRFYQELLDALKRRSQAADVPLRISIDYVRVKSYVGMQSSGQVKVEGADLVALQGRDVVLVEDIIDTGTTLRKLVPLLQSHNPASLRVVSLFQKRLGPEKNPSTEPIPCLHVVGFSLPDKFAVGYGMDYNEMYRDLEHLCLLSPKGVEMHSEEK